MLKPGCDEEEKCRFIKKCIFSVTFETLKKTVHHESDNVIEVQCLNNGELIAISLFEPYLSSISTQAISNLLWGIQWEGQVFNHGDMAQGFGIFFGALSTNCKNNSHKETFFRHVRKGNKLS